MECDFARRVGGRLMGERRTHLLCSALGSQAGGVVICNGQGLGLLLLCQQPVAHVGSVEQHTSADLERLWADALVAPVADSGGRYAQLGGDLFDGEQG